MGAGGQHPEAREPGLSAGKPPAATAGTASRLLLWAVILLPAVLAFLFVYWFGVNSVSRDQWAIVTFLERLSSGTLGFSDLWVQHNEHRIVFPKIAMLGLATLTDYNTRAEMYLVLACFLGTLACLLLAFRSSVSGKLLLFVPVAFLAFSLRQHGNILWGFQVTFAFVLLFSVLALFLLYLATRGRSRRIVFPAALLSATVASLSAAQGLFAWPVGVLQILISPVERRTKRLLAGVWGLAGAVVWGIYLYGLGSGYGSSPLENLGRPVAGAEFFLTLLGSALTGRQGLAFAAGLLLAALAAASLILLYRSGRWSEDSFWLALLLFSALTVASIAAGRTDIGIEEALLSRYATFSILAVVATYALLAKAATDGRSPVTGGLFGLLLALLVLTLPVAYSEGLTAGQQTMENRQEAASALATYESQPEEYLDEVHGWDDIRNRAVVLDDLGYSVFAERSGGTPGRPPG